MMVSDEVWSKLDPGAGKLSRRETVTVWVTVAAVAVLIVAGILVWRSGLIVPRLEWPNDSWGWEIRDDGVMRVHVPVANKGSFPATVAGLGRSAPGFELLRVEGDLPATLEPGERREFTLVYRLTDCAAAPRDMWPVVAEVDTLVGTVTVDVPQRPTPIESWQAMVVDSFCDP